MSVVKGAARLFLYLFSFIVVLLVAGAIYFYLNMNGMAKDVAERVASNALGVRVTIEEMDISLEEQKVVVHNVFIANPEGYQKENAIHIGRVTVALENWSEDMLTFAMVGVDDTSVFLEVQPGGTNLGDIKNLVEARSKTVIGEKPTASQVADVEAKKEDIKVIIRDFVLNRAQVTPSSTLIGSDLNTIILPDIRVQGVGEQENGVLANEAVAQIMNGVLQQINKYANSVGFLEGLSLDVMNKMGVSTIDVFKKNLKKSYDDDVDKFKQGVESLKNILQQ